jgi:hypothetical protein
MDRNIPGLLVRKKRGRLNGRAYLGAKTYLPGSHLSKAGRAMSMARWMLDRRGYWSKTTVRCVRRSAPARANTAVLKF